MTRPEHEPAQPDGGGSPPNSQPSRGPTPADPQHVWPAAVLLLLAGAAAYVNSFDGIFLYDELGSIRDNPHIRTLWPLSEAMSLPLLQGRETVARRPLLSLSFALNYVLLGPKPEGFHAVNLMIHLTAGLLLLGIVRRTLSGERFGGRYAAAAVPLAFVVALLWTIHPLQTESVTYVVQRAESLMGMLYLLTLYCSLRGFESPRPGAWYAAAIAACAAGMGVKEVMFTAPLAVLLYDGTFVSASLRAAWRRRRGFYAALAATWSVLLLLLVVGWEEASRDFTDRSPWAYLLTQPGVIVHYLRLSLWPDALVMEYNWPLARSPAEIVPYAAVIVLMLAITAWGVGHRKWYGFVGGWFFLTLAPSSSFAALAQTIAEHRMYLALAAVIVLLVLAAHALLRRLLPWAAARRVAGATLVLAAACGLLGRTVLRNELYHDAVAFWSDNIQHRPGAYVAHANLGNALFYLTRTTDAIACYQRALALNPNLYEVYTNLGRAYASLESLEKAIAQFRQALLINSEFAPAHAELASAYDRQGFSDEALYHYREAARLAPDSVDAQRRLAAACAERGLADEAIRLFRGALLIDPDSYTTHMQLAGILAAEQRYEEAATHYARAAELKQDSATAHYNLGAALVQLRRTEEAARHLQRASALDRRLWQAHLLLGVVRLEQGDRQRAIDHLLQAQKLKPDSADVQELLRRAREE